MAELCLLFSPVQVWQCSRQNQVSLISDLSSSSCRGVSMHRMPVGLYSGTIPACHPILLRALPPCIWHRFQLCPPTKVSECALHLERPAVNTVASHGMPLFAFIGQTTSDRKTGLCELDTIVKLLVFSLVRRWQVSNVDTYCGHRHFIHQGVKALLS